LNSLPISSDIIQDDVPVQQLAELTIKPKVEQQITIENIHTIHPSLSPTNIRVSLRSIIYGDIYILSNPAFISIKSQAPLYKIGYTKGTVIERAKQLYKTGVPQPFNIEAHYSCDRVYAAETVIHNVLRSMRENRKREFFCVPLEVAKLVVENVTSILNKM